MNLNDTILRNLYEELNLAMYHHATLERRYRDICERVDQLNRDIIERKKIISKQTT